MEAEVMVKRVINGKAYNTDTSELVAHAHDNQPDLGNPYDVRVYRTREGAYFETYVDFGSNHTGIVPLTRDRAKAIVSNMDERYRMFKFDIVGNADELLVDVTEAKAGDVSEIPSQEAVIFFRASKTFKTSVENAAKESELSVNAWLLRISEKAMQPTGMRHEKEQLLMEIEGAIYFRETTAQRYPQDNRNTKSVEALKGLYAHIETLPGDHPLFDAIALTCHYAEGDFIDIEFFKELNDELSQYGFYSAENHQYFVDRRIVDSAKFVINFYDERDK